MEPHPYTGADLIRGEQDAEVAEVVAGGAGDEGGSQTVEQRRGVEAVEGLLGLGAEGGGGEGAVVDDGSGGGAVAVDAVRSGGEDGGCGVGWAEQAGGVEGELLVASAEADGFALLGCIYAVLAIYIVDAAVAIYIVLVCRAAGQ